MSCRISDTEPHYYADGEDAYDMRKHLKPKSPLADTSPTGKASKEKRQQEKAGATKDKEQHARSDAQKGSPSSGDVSDAPETPKKGDSMAPARAKGEGSGGSSGTPPSSGTPKKGKGGRGKS